MKKFLIIAALAGLVNVVNARESCESVDADMIKHLDPSTDEYEKYKLRVLEHGYQVDDVWYIRVLLDPLPPSIKIGARPYLVQMVGSVAYRLSDSSVSLDEKMYEIEKYVPAQCAKLKSIGFVADKQKCVAFVKANVEKHACENRVMIFNIRFGNDKGDKYKVITSKFIGYKDSTYYAQLERTNIQIKKYQAIKEKAKAAEVAPEF